MNNYDVYVKYGEIGEVIDGLLTEANGAPVDLTDWTGEFIASKQDGSTAIIQRAIVPDADQTYNSTTKVGNRGKWKYTFTAEDFAAVRQNHTYSFEIKITHASNDIIRKFPKVVETADKIRAFGTLHILPSVS